MTTYDPFLAQEYSSHICSHPVMLAAYMDLGASTSLIAFPSRRLAGAVGGDHGCSCWHRRGSGCRLLGRARGCVGPPNRVRVLESGGIGCCQRGEVSMCLVTCASWSSIVLRDGVQGR